VTEDREYPDVDLALDELDAKDKRSENSIYM